MQYRRPMLLEALTKQRGLVTALRYKNSGNSIAEGVNHFG
ncbi:MAG: hypothetical protein QOE77_1052 [Blastocatellia bacterium]|jgi:hypothetical protein|nr:hypothetical protein [Blastocatellia bacterium]